MTTTTTTYQPSVESGLPGIVRSFVAQCSDRELADMNLSRADINHVVRSWQPG